MKHEKRYRSTEKVKNRFKKFRIAPYLEILLGLGLLAAFGWAAWTYGVPFMKGLATHAYSCKEPEATPSPTPVPTPEPTRDPYPDHALYGADLKSLQTEIVIPEFQYATDLSVVDGTILAAVGNYTPDGTAAFVRAYLYDVKAGTHTFLALPLQNKSIRFPAMNERWIVYLDSAANGGGRMMAYNRQTGEAKALKTVHTGLPRPVVWENTAIWIERTGQTRDKLFAVDLETGESVTIAIFDNSPHALSKPSVYGGTLLYVAPDGALTAFDLKTGESETVPVEADIVHDPQQNADGIAFLDSDHAKSGRLLFWNGKETVEVVTGAVDFFLGDGFIAYSRYDRNYVYYYGDGTTFCTTRSDETAMLLAAGGDVIVWMDVTWRDKDIMEFMTVGD
jgi:outer membrane protein assembly factor BamB